MKLLLLGIGQSMRGDDAAGLEAVRLWQQTFSETAGKIRVEVSELPGLTLLDYLHDMDVAILVDAVQSGAPAGTLHRLGPADLDAFSAGTASAHGWGVAETLQLGRSLDPDLQKCRISLIGIEAGQMGIGAGLSDAVQAALPAAVKMIEQEITALLQ